MTDERAPRFIVIAGMHRSGTSLVARVVNLLGVDLGPPASLMEPKPDNPTGFWESVPVAAFNDDLLGELGGRWDDPPVLVDGWERQTRFDSWKERAQRLIDEEFGTSELGGWKDPRMSLLLPFWRSVVDIENVLVVLRDPGAVAASLAARDGMDEEVAADLWLRYTVAALRNAPRGRVVRYQDFFDDFDATIDAVAEAIGRPAPEASVRRQASDFFETSLRHHVPSPMSGPMGEAAEWIFGSEMPLPPTALDILWDGLREVRGAEDSRRKLATLLETTEADRTRLESQVAEIQNEVDRLKTVEERLGIERDALERQERIGRVLRDRLVSAEEEVVELRRRIADRSDDAEASKA